MTQQECARVRQANGKMEEEIVELSDSKLEDLQEKRELLIKDLDKFKLLISNLERHHEEVVKKTDQLKTDSAAKEKELQAAEKEREELSNIIASQDAANIDAQRITGERNRLVEELKRAALEKDRIQGMLYEAEVQLANKQVEVERAVSEYNELGRELKIMPSSAKHANGQDYEIPLQTRGNSIDQLISLGGKTTLKADLVALHAALAGRVRDAAEDKIGHEEREREVAEQVAEKRREVKSREEECRAKESQLQRDKDALDAELKTMNAEVCEIEEALASGSSVSARRLAQAKKRVEDLTTKMAQEHAEARRRNRDMGEVLMSISHMMAAHKLQVQERLEEVDRSCKLIQEQIATA